MANAIKLDIPEPCTESWNGMIPAGNGRFCSGCSKVVVDFSGMTDKEVLDYFTSISTNTCGRFETGQLNRIITTENSRTNSWFKYVIKLLVPAMMMSVRSSAQGRIRIDSINAFAKPDVVACSSKIDSTISIRLGGVTATSLKRNEPIIHGKVISVEGLPIQMVPVEIKGTDIRTLTDSNGNFSLNADKHTTVTLVVSAVGYVIEEVQVNSRQRKGKQLVILKLEPMVLGEVLITNRRVSSRRIIFHQFKKFITDSIQRTSFSVYPNPAVRNSIVTVSGKLNKGAYTICLVNVSGSIMQEEKLNVQNQKFKTSFSLVSSLPGGHYTLVLMDNKRKKVATRSIIIN